MTADADAQANYAALLFEIGNLNEAAAAFRRALALNPATIHARIGLANVLQDSAQPDSAQPDEAIATLERALVIDPKNADHIWAWQDRGRAGRR